MVSTCHLPDLLIAQQTQSRTGLVRAVTVVVTVPGKIPPGGKSWEGSLAATGGESTATCMQFLPEGSQFSFGRAGRGPTRMKFVSVRSYNQTIWPVRLASSDGTELFTRRAELAGRSQLYEYACISTTLRMVERKSEFGRIGLCLRLSSDGFERAVSL